ncbi:hypothetical protein BX070DRAFT_223909 [Coemansia spiralis]|nr:hypothetical protein BX070DRAFT_223909 [Coemansia spiralis]
MPFSSTTAPELSLELTAPRQNTFTGTLVVHIARAQHHMVALELVGEESVSLRAWSPFPTVVSREVLRHKVTLASGILNEGHHVFPFTVVVPTWAPSTVSNDLCRIRYTLRATADAASVVRELNCHRVRASQRLARRKKIDQSVGCPDGSCHVRFWGTISRDVVKPGSELKIDIAARTSDARFGLRLLVANFAECLMCHVQVRGEERMVNKITNLASQRLDALGDKAVHRSRSRLTDLIRTKEGLVGPAARQISASQVIQVPRELSQFSSDLVSREYRLMLVAEVTRLDDPSDTVHVNTGSARSSVSTLSDAEPDTRPIFSEQSSAIAGWPIEIVDHFSVCFDELLVAPPAENDKERASEAVEEPEIRVGQHRFTETTQRGHHRRTSSGLRGFLMRGFRSATQSPRLEDCVFEAVSPTSDDEQHPRPLSSSQQMGKHVYPQRQGRSNSAPFKNRTPRRTSPQT